jgi:uncharacterized protein YjbI with pentapeptide repeats
MIGGWIGKLWGREDTPSRERASAGAEEANRLSADRLRSALQKHRRWLASRGQSGERADLRGAVVSRGGGRLANISLAQADLRGAVLRGMTLDNVHLDGALLRDADLSGAHLVKTLGLSAAQLAAADLSGASLPVGIDLEPHDGIRDAARTARALFVLTWVACLYALIVVAGTQDAAFFLNSPGTILPILQAPVRLPQFYWLAPAAIALLYVVSHLYLLRLWQRVSILPAVYPDGSTADHRLPPWLFHGFVQAFWPRLRPLRPPLFALQFAVSILTAWIVPPLTLVVLWARYLVRHDGAGTVLQLALALGAAAFGVYAFSLAGAALRGELAPQADPDERSGFWTLFPPVHGIAVITLTVILGLYSVKAIGAFGLRPLHVPDLSWTDLTGADLKSADLTGAELFRAKLNSADLRGADLASANLDEAELSGAKLGQAMLDGASLREARLERADLSGASLRGAQLDQAQLPGATLSGADLSRALIRKANLSGAAVDSARMEGSDFTGSDLRKANVSFSQGGESRFTDAVLDGADLRTINLTAADLTRARLNGANLENATLMQVRAAGADLGEANLRGTDMKFSTLEGADLRQADLAKADVRGANLLGAAFGKANLSGANLIEAQVDCVRVGFATFDRETRLPTACAGTRTQ